MGGIAESKSELYGLRYMQIDPMRVAIVNLGGVFAFISRLQNTQLYENGLKGNIHTILRVIDIHMDLIKRVTTLKHIGNTGTWLVMVLLALLWVSTPVLAESRQAAIVVDAESGEVLHESNADASRYPASLTKMMTLYMLFEAMQQRRMTLDTLMPVSLHAASMPPTKINLKAGEVLSVQDAIPALIVRSANDVAAVVAEALGDTESQFARMMTDKARKLGMYSTTFRNASGLPDWEQKTTARDLMILSARLMQDFPQYYHYFSTRSFSYKGTVYNSHNRMVKNIPGVDGLKTGFIRASGFNVATSAKRGGRRVIAVVMGGQTAAARDQTMAQLLERSFGAGENFTSQLANHAHPVPSRVTPDRSHKQKANTNKLASTAKKSDGRKETRKAASAKQKIWEVQIGSYNAHNRAQAKAQAVTRWLPGSVVISEVEVSKRKMYRARVVGLLENQARSACQSLTKQKMECLVVRSHG